MEAARGSTQRVDKIIKTPYDTMRILTSFGIIFDVDVEAVGADLS